jgi:hypothetical protein
MESRNDPDRRNDPILINSPPITPLYPISDCAKVARRFAGIPIDAAFNPTPQCGNDGLGHAKVHIGHPHRKHAVITQLRVGALPRFRLAVPDNELPLQGTPTPVVPFSINIDGHCCLLHPLVD